MAFITKPTTEEPLYNDSVCPPRFCSWKEFAAIKSPHMYQYDKKLFSPYLFQETYDVDIC